MTGKFPVTPVRHTMYDSINAGSIPVGASKMAGYVNGAFPSYHGMVSRFHQSRVFGIDVLGGAWHIASILDYEEGNPCYKRPDLVRDFIINRNRLFPDTACVYSDASDLGEVEDYAEGLWHVLWVANWGIGGTTGESLTGLRTKRGNLVVATQVRNDDRDGYDVSDTLESWV